MSKLRLPVTHDDIPTMALYLTILAVMMNPELVEWEVHEFFEDYLGGGKLTVEEWKEAIRALNSKTFSPEYDWVN